MRYDAARRQAAGKISISVFGLLRISARGSEYALAARKDRALVAYLALRAGERVSRARLAGLLWGESGDRPARNSLKQALLRVRKLFSAIDAQALIIDRSHVSFSPEHMDVDALKLEAALQGGDHDVLEALLAPVRGVPLEGLEVETPSYLDWFFAERSRLEGLVVAALLKLMRQAASDGCAERAEMAAHRLMLADPFNEEAIRHLMQLRAAQGDRRRAIDLYNTLRNRLSDELNIDPEPETTDLAVSIGRRQPVRRLQNARHTDNQKSTGSETSDASYRTLVLVVPFHNLGDDLVQDSLAQGLAEDIATDIARIPDIMVSHENAASFPHVLHDQLAIANEIGATHLLTGSVRRYEQRLRVSARLVETQGGRQVWANRFDRPMAGIFELQDELAGEVGSALKHTLLVRETVDRFRRGTSDVAAYELFLKARSFHMRGADGHSLNIARVLYERAIELDPRYALAHAHLAICRSHLSMSKSHEDDETYESCIRLSRQALELDPYLAEAHAGLGLSLYAAGEYVEAELALDRAIRLSPNLFEAVFFKARNRRLQGDRQGAAELFRRAADLRPQDYRSVGLLGEELQALGQESEALSAHEKCLERLRAEIDAHPGNADALAFGSAVLGKLGLRDQAADWARWALLLGDGQRLIHYNVARTLLGLGRTQEALRELGRAFDTQPRVRQRLIMWAEKDEDLAALRDTPQFRQLTAPRP